MEWRGTPSNRYCDTGSYIIYTITGMTGEHIIAEIKAIQARHPGMRISGQVALVVAEPDQLELFEAEDRSEP